jgi:hypothetical protein
VVVLREEEAAAVVAAEEAVDLARADLVEEEGAEVLPAWAEQAQATNTR